MNFRLRRFLFLTASAAAMPFIPGIAKAQTYPARPVRVIVPFSPGGPTDVFARIVAGNLTRSLGQHFYVENQPGAGGNLGMGAGARAASDGYTVMVVSTSYVVNPSLRIKIPTIRSRILLPSPWRPRPPMCFWFIHRFRRTTSKSSSCFSKKITASTATPTPESAPRHICPGKCSGTRKILISWRCRSLVRRQPSSRPSPVIPRSP